VHIFGAQLKLLLCCQDASLVQHCMRRCMRNSTASDFIMRKPALICML
jgi:hypothetical protein